MKWPRAVVTAGGDIIIVKERVISLLMSLPWIGGITQLVVLLVGFGALVLERRDRRHRLQSVTVHEQP